MAERRADLDTPWKDVLVQLLPEALALFVPTLHADIDSTVPVRWLDKELQQVAPDAATGRRIADLLVAVALTDGREQWLLVHLEVQAQHDPAFARRVFIEHVRLLDRYGQEVVSIALLVDPSPRWRPDHYAVGRPESRVVFTFTTVKLLDWRGREEELRRLPNPFALVVRAHLAALATRRRRGERFDPKLGLVKDLLAAGHPPDRVAGLLRFVDWVLQLPREQDAPFRRAVQEYVEEQHMPYVTSFERLAKEEGRMAGKAEVLAGMVESWYDAELAAAVRECNDAALLDAVAEALRRRASESEVRTILQRQ